MDRFSLQDRVALITGGGRGIGAGIARGFAEAGATVAVVARTQADVDALAEEIRAAGGRALALTADVRDLDALPAVIDRTVDEFGGLDILVNNAGGEVSPPFLETPRRPHHRRHPLQRGGAVRDGSTRGRRTCSNDPGASIINISSTTTLVSVRGSLAHHTGKAAESQLTLSMAADLGPRIRVNAILPAAIETEALARFFEIKDPGMRDTLASQSRMRRLGTPDDVASAAIYLASPAASWVTGLLLELTGGRVDEYQELYPDL